MKPDLIPSKYNYSTIRSSSDNTKWIIGDKPNKSGTKDWISLDTKENVKKYQVHDNGARPFLVVISDKKIIIYKDTELYEKDKKKRKLMSNNEIKFDKWSPCLIISKYKQVFVGINEKKYTCCPNYGRFIGNTILIEIKLCEYLFIGSDIRQFKTLEPVISYHSVMGNNDVPYPFTLTNKYIYLIGCGDVYTNRIENDPDPYTSYFGSEQIYKTKFIKYKYKILVKRWIDSYK